MKLIYNTFLLLLFIFSSCTNDERNSYVSLKGKIVNKNSDFLKISKGNYSKIIKVDKNGTFKDTLLVSFGKYLVYDGKEYFYITLNKGFNLELNYDTKKIDLGEMFSGIGAATNEYVYESIKYRRTKMMAEIHLFSKEKDDKIFNDELILIEKELNYLIKKIPESSLKLNPELVEQERKELQYLKDNLKEKYRRIRHIADSLPEGIMSPKFVNYEKYKGKETSLDDFKGKYVYLDFWATWCGPCIKEIPFLEKIERKYHSKNIDFVSISIDEEKNRLKWIEMIEEKNMKGIQLLAREKDSFLTKYDINSIPRFVLIGPDGKIINNDAPRPSDSLLIALLNSLDI